MCALNCAFNRFAAVVEHNAREPPFFLCQTDLEPFPEIMIRFCALKVPLPVNNQPTLVKLLQAAGSIEPDDHRDRLYYAP